MAYAAPMQVVNTGFKVSPIFATTANLTLYVRTTGSDSNTGLASGTALLTIQEAINRIPLSIRHTVVVDIGEGTFGGFVLPSRAYTAEAASLTIKGVTDLATGLASGTNSGTATGGSTTTLVDAGQSWTVNNLRGRMALVNSEYRIIYSNDATSLTFVGPFTLTCSGKAYQIVEQKTILNTLGSTDSVILVGGQIGCKSAAHWTLQDIKITTPVGASYFGLQQLNTATGILSRVAVVSQASQTGINIQAVFGLLSSNDLFVSGGATGIAIANAGTMPLATPLNRIFCLNTTSVGCRVSQTAQSTLQFFYANTCVTGALLTNSNISQILNGTIESCVTAGVTAQYVSNLNFSGQSGIGLSINSCQIGVLIQGSPRANIGNPVTIQSSTSHGVSVTDLTNAACGPNFVYVNSAKIINNGGSGIFARGPATIRINALDTAGGTGNTRFGIELEDGAKAFVRSGIIANPLTGAMGDATIDDAKAVLVWAVDFAVNLDIAVDATGIGTAIKRRD